MPTDASSRPCSTRLLDNPALADELGENGRAFYEAHYEWPVIERAYLDMFERLAAGEPAEPMEPLPGWLAARARTARPGAAVVDAAPRGPVRESREERYSVKLAFITPRYGADLIAGPEHACRLLAEHIGQRHDVDVLTTLRARFAHLEERVPGGPGPRPRRAHPPLSGHRTRPRSGGGCHASPRGSWPNRTRARRSSTGYAGAGPWVAGR